MTLPALTAFKEAPIVHIKLHKLRSKKQILWRMRLALLPPTLLCGRALIPILSNFIFISTFPLVPDEIIFNFVREGEHSICAQNHIAHGETGPLAMEVGIQEKIG